MLWWFNNEVKNERTDGTYYTYLINRSAVKGSADTLYFFIDINEKDAVFV